jgi:hypothetical protein
MRKDEEIDELGNNLEGDARYGDERLPRQSAREHPDGSRPESEGKPGYKNTDEAF